MIVADTNLIASLFVGELRERDLSTRIGAAVGDWTAPPLWRSELLATLRKYVRFRGLSSTRAAGCFYEAAARVSTSDVEIAAEHVLGLSALSNCSTYDCEFVAVAMALGRPLVTFDRRLQAAFPSIAVAPGAFLG